MNKAAMEFHYQQYHAFLDMARTCISKREFRKALEHVRATWGHIDGMIRFEKKQGVQQLDTIDSIALVLRYAPVLFDYRLLDDLESLIRNQRRIERDTDIDLASAVEDARRLMWLAQAIWSLVEEHGEISLEECQRRMKVSSVSIQSLVDGLVEVGSIQKRSLSAGEYITLSMRTGEVVDGKCSACGHVTQGPKAMFFEVARCPSCQETVDHVILSDSAMSCIEG